MVLGSVYTVCSHAVVLKPFKKCHVRKGVTVTVYCVCEIECHICLWVICVPMKLDKKIRLQYPLIKGTILIGETDSTHFVPRMPFFNSVPLKGEALFMGYDMLVHPRCVARVSLFHQLRDSSMFDVFIRGEICCFKAWNRWKSLGAKAGLYGVMVRHFPIEICRKFQVSCTTCSQAL
jgi:hypothetical protein